MCARSVSGAGALLNCSHALGRVEAEPGEPPLDEPARMRQRRAQIRERRLVGAEDGGARRQGECAARRLIASQHGVDEAGGARFFAARTMLTASSTTAAAGTRSRWSNW